MAFPERTPGWTLSGRFGKLLRAHSSSQGMSSSSEIFSRVAVRVARGVWIGEVKASAATIVERRANPNFIVTSGLVLIMEVE